MTYPEMQDLTIKSYQMALPALAVLACISGLRQGFFLGRVNWPLIRAAMVLVVGYTIMGDVEGWLDRWPLPWTALAVETAALAVVTRRPSGDWDFALGATFAAMMLGSSLAAITQVWGPGLTDWQVETYWWWESTLGFFQLIILALWTGGTRVESLISRAAGWINGLGDVTRRHGVA